MKTKSILSLIFTVSILFITSSVISAQPVSNDFHLMLKWFAGEFDNFQQVQQEKEDSVAVPHEHMHSLFLPVEIPAVGDHVFYIRQYADGDPNKVYRIRLYTFHPLEKGERIELRIWAFKEETKFRNAHTEPDILKTLTKDDLKGFPGCELQFKRDGDAFKAKLDINNRTCRVVSSRSGRTLFFGDEIVLTRDEIWIHESAVDDKGNPVFGRKDNVPHKLKRCHYFDGWAVVPYVVEGEEKYHVFRNLSLHDQGDRKRLVTSDGDSLDYWVELARLTYTQTNIDVLKLAFYNNLEERAFAYTWTEPHAHRIGMNLRYIQSGFTKRVSDLDRLATMMTGSFTSEAQAAADTNFFDIRLEMKPIWQHRTDGVWLYVEQAAAQALDKPYRQRVYHVTEQEDGSFKSAVFTMDKPLRFAGAWREIHPLAALTPDSLEEKTGCAVFLKKQKDGSFYGSTVEQGCISVHRGASYATSEVTVTEDGIISWDRGFNNKGEQVWGSEHGGYIFRKTRQ